MNTELITVQPDDEITRVVHLFVEHDISGVPVVDQSGALVGILTERDCINVALHAGYFDEPGGIVRDFMTAPVRTVNPEDNLIDVAELLATTTYRRFPVLDDGRLIGLISRRDVLDALVSGAWFSRPKEPAVQ